MLGEATKWRLVVGLTAAIGGSFFAGCCGGPFGADGTSDCGACVEPAASSDPGCAAGGSAGMAGKGGSASGGSSGSGTASTGGGGTTAR